MRNYYRDEVNHAANEIDDNDKKINNSKRTTRNSFAYKAKIIRSRPNNNNILDLEVISLKYFSNFWRSLGLPLINYEIRLDVI